MIPRNHILSELNQAFKVNPVVALLGPRQCGKTTLARNFSQQNPLPSTFFDLEDLTDLEKLNMPKLALEELDGLIIIDEIQRRPNLFPYLRVLVDRFPKRRYLILGSASRDLIGQSSETLAGRISYLPITPFQYREVHDLKTLLLRGGFPRSFLAENNELSWQWRKAYIQSYLEQDLPSLGITLAPMELRRFWVLLAHYHGQTINYSEIATIMGLSDQTVRRYIALMESTFMVKQLRPWFENLKKRQVKSPKFYVRDSGILLNLLNMNETNLLAHPKSGAVWEGFALEALTQHYKVDLEDTYFWNAPRVGEIDCLFVQGMQQTAFEFKYTDKPLLTKSILSIIETLKLSHLTIVVPIATDYYLHEKVRVIGLENILKGSDA